MFKGHTRHCLALTLGNLNYDMAHGVSSFLLPGHNRPDPLPGLEEKYNTRPGKGQCTRIQAGDIDVDISCMPGVESQKRPGIGPGKVFWYNMGMKNCEIEQEMETWARGPLFEGLSQADLAAVAETARRQKAERGAFFFHEGDPATRLYVLIAGRVKLGQLTAEGQQVLLRFACAGEMFGGIGTLAGTAYPASAEAVEDCVALAWEGRAMIHLMEHHPRLAINALRLLAGQMQEMQERFRELATERVDRRLARALLRLASQTGRQMPGGILLDIRLSRQDLADMTGTTVYTVSRILSRWEQAGLVKSRRERVLIRQPNELNQVAQDLDGEL